MSDYKIVRLQKNNIHLLTVLFAEVHGKKIGRNYFAEKYDTRYTGVDYLGYFAFYKDTPVAYFGVIPVWLSMSAQRILAGQAVDAMTSKKFRSKGLFCDVASQTFELARAESVNFIFGFPNQNSYNTLVSKLGFSTLETMNGYTFHSGSNWFKKWTKRLSNFNPATSSEGFKNTLTEQGYDGVIYDPAYLKYKAHNPNFFYAENNFIAWLNAKNKEWLGAVNLKQEVLPEETITSILKKTGMSSLTYLISPGNPVNDFFSGLMEPAAAFPIIIKDLGQDRDFSKLKFQFSDIDVF